MSAGFFAVVLVFAGALASPPALADLRTKNSPVCPVGQHWVKPHSKRAYIRADGAVVRASFVSGHCRENFKGYSFWKSKLISSRPSNWPKKLEKERAWTAEEEERVLEALGDLPEILWSAAVRGIYRMKESEISGNPASTRPGSMDIVLYDSAFAESASLARILSHELAHVLFGRLSLSDREEYLLVARWFSFAERGKKPKFIRRANGFTEEDGKDSPEEDFANNVETFLFEPQRLANIVPTIHHWLTRRFGDKFLIRRTSSREGKK